MRNRRRNLATGLRPNRVRRAGAFHEAHPGQFAHLLAIQAGLEVEFELVQGLDPGEARQFETGFGVALKTTLPFGLQGLHQEVLVIQLALRRLLAHGIQLVLQMIQLQFFEEVV